MRDTFSANFYPDPRYARRGASSFSKKKLQFSRSVFHLNINIFIESIEISIPMYVDSMENVYLFDKSRGISFQVQFTAAPITFTSFTLGLITFTLFTLVLLTTTAKEN